MKREEEKREGEKKREEKKEGKRERRRREKRTLKRSEEWRRMKEKEEKMREEENALDWVRSDRLLLPSSTSLSSLHFRLHSHFSSFSFSSPLLLLVTFSSFFPSLLLSSLLSSFAVLHRAEVYIFIYLLSSLLLRCEFEDVVLDQEGPGVGIHMFIVIVNRIDISALVAHRGQAPVPPPFSLFNRESAGTSRRGAPGRNQLVLLLATGREARHQ